MKELNEGYRKTRYLQNNFSAENALPFPNSIKMHWRFWTGWRRLSVNSRWKECKLGDVAEVIDSLHKTPEKYVEVGYPMVRVTDVKKGKLDLSKTLKVDKNTFEEFSKKHIPKCGDIIFTRVGTYGNTCFVGQNTVFCLGQNTAFIIPKANPYFLYYFLNSPEANNQIEGSVGGSTQPTISLKSIKEIDIAMPPLLEQRAIAGVLSSLDDKIDLLHRQNKTLEGMAEALWRKMFIEDADPNWTKGKLGDCITVKGGTTPSTKNAEFWDGNIYWTTPRDLSGSNKVFLHDTERRITERGLSQIGSGLLPIGTVLLSSRAPIGYLTISNIPVAINQGYIAIICDSVFSNYYMYLWVKSNIDLIIGSANGSTFLEISKSVFKDLETEVPNEKDIKKFDSNVKPLFEKILINEIQIRTLSRLRETLLPKLMTGEVRVKM